MRRALLSLAVAAASLSGASSAQAICAGNIICTLDGCRGTVNVCPTSDECRGGVNVCPGAETCVGIVNVCDLRTPTSF